MWRGNKESQKWSESQKTKSMDLQWERNQGNMLWVSPKVTSFWLLPSPKDTWSRAGSVRQAGHGLDSTGIPTGPPPHMTLRKRDTLGWKSPHCVNQYHHTNTASKCSRTLLANPFVRLQLALYFILQCTYPYINSPASLLREQAAFPPHFPSLRSSVHHGPMVTLHQDCSHDRKAFLYVSTTSWTHRCCTHGHNVYWWGIYYMAGSGLSALHLLTLSPSDNPTGRCCFHFHFMQRVSEAQRSVGGGGWLTQGHKEWDMQDSNSGPFSSEPMMFFTSLLY